MIWSCMFMCLFVLPEAHSSLPYGDAWTRRFFDNITLASSDLSATTCQNTEENVVVCENSLPGNHSVVPLNAILDGFNEREEEGQNGLSELGLLPLFTPSKHASHITNINGTHEREHRTTNYSNWASSTSFQGGSLTDLGVKDVFDVKHVEGPGHLIRDLQPTATLSPVEELSDVRVADATPPPLPAPLLPSTAIHLPRMGADAFSVVEGVEHLEQLEGIHHWKTTGAEAEVSSKSKNYSGFTNHDGTLVSISQLPGMQEIHQNATTLVSAANASINLNESKAKNITASARHGISKSKRAISNTVQLGKVPQVEVKDDPQAEIKYPPPPFPVLNADSDGVTKHDGTLVSVSQLPGMQEILHNATALRVYAADAGINLNESNAKNMMVNVHNEIKESKRAIFNSVQLGEVPQVVSDAPTPLHALDIAEVHGALSFSEAVGNDRGRYDGEEQEFSSLIELKSAQWRKGSLIPGESKMPPTQSILLESGESVSLASDKGPQTLLDGRKWPRAAAGDAEVSSHSPENSKVHKSHGQGKVVRRSESVPILSDSVPPLPTVLITGPAS